VLVNLPCCCYPIFDPCFDNFSEKNQKIAKNNENPKKYIFDIFASCLAFSMSSQKNLNFSKVFGTRSTFNA